VEATFTPTLDIQYGCRLVSRPRSERRPHTGHICLPIFCFALGAFSSKTEHGRRSGQALRWNGSFGDEPIVGDLTPERHTNLPLGTPLHPRTTPYAMPLMGKERRMSTSSFSDSSRRGPLSRTAKKPSQRVPDLTRPSLHGPRNHPMRYLTVPHKHDKSKDLKKSKPINSTNASCVKENISGANAHLLRTIWMRSEIS